MQIFFGQQKKLVKCFNKMTINLLKGNLRVTNLSSSKRPSIIPFSVDLTPGIVWSNKVSEYYMQILTDFLPESLSRRLKGCLCKRGLDTSSLDTSSLDTSRSSAVGFISARNSSPYHSSRYPTSPTFLLPYMTQIKA